MVENGPSFRKLFIVGRFIVSICKAGECFGSGEVHRGRPQSAIHVKNSYASETPVTDGKRVYCYFGNLGVFVFDMLGNPKWSKRFTTRKTR